MKVSINQNGNIKETEVIINCSSLDNRIRNLISFIQQYSTSIEGSIDDAIYYIPLDSILYIDSVDKKTYFYDCHRIFNSPCSLAELEEKLQNALFVRISKNCIVNIAYISRICPHENHRMKVIMKNGEHLLVGRVYKELLKERLKDFNADTFYIAAAMEQKDVFEHYPERSVYNAGKVISFMTVPKRVVALSYENAELLAALGLAERIVAIAPAECGIEQVSPEYRELLRSVPVITHCNHGIPCLSEIAALNPDFVLGNIYSLRKLQKISMEKISDYGINLYVVECTIPERTSIENFYKDILNLGRIFHVEDRAVGIVEDMRKRISSLTRRVIYRHKVNVFVYDGGENFPITAGGDTLENNLIFLAGGNNVFGHIQGGYQEVTRQQIADALPECIVIHEYADCMSVSEKLKMLREKEELREVPAIKNNSFVIVSLLETLPGMQNVNMIKKLINNLHPNVL